MKTSSKIYLSGIVLLGVFSVSHATIIDRGTVSISLWEDFYTLSTFAYPMEGVGIDMEWSLHDWGLTLTAVNGLAGIGSHFVEMNYGNLVNHASILAITNPLASGSFGSTSIWGSVDLPVNTSVYLGFQLDASHGPEFGWVELFYDGSTVQALNSATDRDGIGIYVGKFETAAIPEPSTLLLLLIGAPFLRRRKQ